MQLPREFLENHPKAKELSEAEKRVLLALLCEGMTKKQVLENLRIGSSTYKTHMTKIYSCFEIKGRGTGKLDILRSLLDREYRESNFSNYAVPNASVNQLNDVMQRAVSLPAANLPSQQIAQDQADSIPNTPADDLDWFTLRVQAKCQMLHILYKNSGDIVCKKIALDSVYIDIHVDARSLGYETPIHWKELVLNYEKLIIRGKPGSGKTTLLKYIATQFNELDFQQSLVPIFIELVRFRDYLLSSNAPSLVEYISQEYCNGNMPQQVITILKEGKALILLDGLDEVIDEQQRVIQEIFNEDISNNKFIITCRKRHQIPEQLLSKNGYETIEIEGFKNNHINEFVYKWLTGVAGQTAANAENELGKFLEQLDLSENSRIKDIALTPLLLHLILLIFHKREDLYFPSQLHEIYNQSVNLLIEDWNNFVGRLEADEPAINLKKILRQIAATFFENDNSGSFSFKDRKIQKIIKSNLPGFAQINDLDELEDRCEKLLKSIEVRSGLLIKRDNTNYAFSHLTFQEYFTARDFYNRFESNPEALEDLLKHITEPRWREVFLLVTEMLQPADKMLYAMKQRIKQLPEIAEDDDLQNFLREMNEKSRSASIPYQYRSHSRDTSKSFRAAYRAFYLSSVLDLDLTLERAFWDVESLSSGHILDYASGISIPFSNIYYFREYSLASSLISAFPRIRESAYSPISALEVARIFEPAIAHKLLELLNPIKEQINYQKRLSEKGKTIGEWWKANGQTWTNQLKT